MRFTRIVIVPILLGACQQAETPQQADARVEAESKAARAEIEPMSVNFARWFTIGAVDSAAAHLANDYRWQGPNAPAGSGRDAWVTMMNGMMATGNFEFTHKTESVIASGPIAVESGRFVMRVTPRTGAPKGVVASADTGKYLWQWRKINGGWRVAQASWNSDLPPQR